MRDSIPDKKWWVIAGKSTLLTLLFLVAFGRERLGYPVDPVVDMFFASCATMLSVHIAMILIADDRLIPAGVEAND